jgi:hypothetical protein
VDLETGAIVAVTLQGADQGDTTTMRETVAEAGEWIAETAAAVNNEAEGERVSAGYAATFPSRSGDGESGRASG